MRVFTAATVLNLLAVTVMAQPNVPEEFRLLVPFRLMPLLHAPELQDELSLNEVQRQKLEDEFFSVHDPEWFQSRLLPIEKQIVVQARLEESLISWLDENFTAEQLARLKQLELRAQQFRMLLRSDVAKELKISAPQLEEFIRRFKATDVASLKLSQASAGSLPKSDLEMQHKKALEAEQELIKILDSGQQSKLKLLLGAKFDTTKLERIYPMAPELVSVSDWINTKPVSLQELRGKVVLLHFYAFQCSNCIANFDVYRRWHDELNSKGVVVLGIQSPETPDERIVASVESAAKKADLKFPILHDVDMKNWNTWGNTMWPTVYVIDKHGYIRLWWQGELRWQGATGDQKIETLVETLLLEK